MKRSSGPGHPWVGLGSTKGAIIDNYGELLVDVVLETLEKWVSCPIGGLPEDPVSLVLGGFSSPMRVFVKGEPHGKEKVAQRRWRIIVMVPIHIVLAEMLIFGTQNEMEIAHWDQTPSKPGLGLAEDSHIYKVWESMKESLFKEELAEADVSGFDFSISEEFFKLDARRRVMLAGAAEDGAFARAVYNCHHVMCRCVFALSDGTMYSQMHPGVMKSGRYVTSSTNSFIRVLMAHSIGAKWCVAMGDDSLEEYVPDAQRKYDEMGVKVKFYKRSVGNFEFCSHIFADGKAYPSKPEKMLFNLIDQGGDFKKKFGLFQQWSFEMRHHPDMDTWVSAIERCGWAAQRNDGQKESYDDDRGSRSCAEDQE